MKRLAKQIPNIITLIRVVSASVMLFSTAYSVLFYVTFAICCASDMLDGLSARALKAQSKKGAAFDSFADLVFLIFTAVIIIPAVDFPVWIWIVAGIIAVVKLVAILLNKEKSGTVFAPHNVLNKISGLTLCIAVILFNFCDVQSTCIAVAVITGISAAYDIVAAVVAATKRREL